VSSAPTGSLKTGLSKASKVRVILTKTVLKIHENIIATPTGVRSSAMKMKVSSITLYFNNGDLEVYRASEKVSPWVEEDRCGYEENGIEYVYVGIPFSFRYVKG
jgi:hypothetical protein